MIKPEDYFTLSPETNPFFSDCTFVWEAIARIADHVQRLVGHGQTIEGEVQRGAYLGDGDIFIAPGAIVEPGAYVQGPAYIGPGAVVRHGAFVRENVILSAGAILGHASEAKNSLFLPGAHAPHFNYVGDSILGQRVNLGAGTKLSNLGILSEKDVTTGKRPTIKLTIDNTQYDTGLTKMGAVLGDGVQTGCNAVLNPGTLIGPRTLVYANLSLRKGFHAADSIIKFRQTIRRVERR